MEIDDGREEKPETGAVSDVPAEERLPFDAVAEVESLIYAREQIGRDRWPRILDLCCWSTLQML
jgi:hypothetical protein